MKRAWTQSPLPAAGGIGAGATATWFDSAPWRATFPTRGRATRHHGNWHCGLPSTRANPHRVRRNRNQGHCGPAPRPWPVLTRSACNDSVHAPHASATRSTDQAVDQAPRHSCAALPGGTTPDDSPLSARPAALQEEAQHLAAGIGAARVGAGTGCAPPDQACPAPCSAQCSSTTSPSASASRCGCSRPRPRTALGSATPASSSSAISSCSRPSRVSRVASAIARVLNAVIADSLGSACKARVLKRSGAQDTPGHAGGREPGNGFTASAVACGTSDESPVGGFRTARRPAPRRRAARPASAVARSRPPRARGAAP